MGHFSDLDLAEHGSDVDRRRYAPEPFGDVSKFAAALGGEVKDGKVYAPAPGLGADDRSLSILFSESQPGQFFIYDAPGSLGAAYAYVRAKLKIAAPVKYDFGPAAMAIWASTTTAKDTLVGIYLRSRGITLTPPPVLRFHAALKHIGKAKSFHPAMVALVSDTADRPTAVHRTYLAIDGSAKAAVEPARKSLGRTLGHAVRLAPAAAEILLAEGIETALSVMQCCGLPGWSALSAPGLRAVVLPPEVRAVTIAADGDEEGINAARAAAYRFKAEGRRVRIAEAPWGFDFNDVLTGRAARG